MIKPKLFLLFILAHFFTQSESCNCMEPKPEYFYCHSDFSARLHVKGEEYINNPNEDLKVYNVDVEHIYKANWNGRVALMDGKLYTTASSGSCGLILMVNKTYIVTGSAAKERAEAYLCSFHKEISQLNHEVKQGFEGEYHLKCL